MTIAELVQEANAFQYSKEYLNLVKECAEISVYNQFLTSQYQMQEDPSMTESVTASFGADYLIESAEAQDIEITEGVVKDKAANVWKFITGKLRKLVDGIITIFSKLGERVTSLFDKSSKLVSYINDHPDMTESFANAAMTIAERNRISFGNAQGNANFKAAVISNLKAVSPEERNSLIAALSTKGSITITGIENGAEINMLGKAVEDLLNTKDQRSANVARTMISGCKTSSILIPIEKSGISKTNAELNRAKKALDSYDLNATKELYSARDTSDVMMTVNSMNAELVKMISADIQAVAKFVNFKAQAIKTIEVAISGDKKYVSKDADGEEGMTGGKTKDND